MAVEYVADFETTSCRAYDIKTHALSQTDSEAWVCAWALVPVMSEPDPSLIVHGRDISGFMSTVHALALSLPRNGKGKRPRLSVFTHNLKYDGEFIMSWLLHGNGQIVDEVRENVLYSFGALWAGVEVTFRDSLKIFPRSAEAIGELYGIPKLRGQWDYDLFRWPDERTPISAQEWEYVDHDVLIISRALADYRAQGYVENTQAGIAYNDRLRRTYPRFKKTWARYLKDRDYEKFVSLFPEDIRPLPYRLHKHLLLSYYGGISYLNPYYACRDFALDNELGPAYSFDVHSMYPAQMHDRPLPVGYPSVIPITDQREAWRLIDRYNCVIADWEGLSLRLKSPENFPVLMFATNPGSSIRMEGKIIECRDEVAVLTGLDCKMMREEYEILGGRITRLYVFKSRAGQYKDFVDYWMGIKQQADKVRNDPTATPEARSRARTQRELAKVMLNSSYGKDGTKLVREVKRTRLDVETDLLITDTEPEIAAIEYYLPSAIFICAWARWQLWSAVRLVRKEFIYCDTDSVKVTQRGYEILTSSPSFDIDDYRLGAWGYEGRYDTARFVRQKTYTYTQGGKRKYITCGAPEDIKAVMRIDDFFPGMEIPLSLIHKETDPKTGKPRQGRLLPVRVRGGVILEETGFKLSPRDNWDEYTGRNMPIDYAQLCRITARNKEVKN